jgi:hypothetical protein
MASPAMTVCVNPIANDQSLAPAGSSASQVAHRL